MRFATVVFPDGSEKGIDLMHLFIGYKKPGMVPTMGIHPDPSQRILYYWPLWDFKRVAEVLDYQAIADEEILAPIQS